MRKIRLLIAFIFAGFLFVAGSTLYAEEVLSLDLQKAIEMAIETSENLKIKENNIDIGKEQVKEAKSAIYPQVESVTTWSGNYDYPNTGLVDDYDLSTGISVDQLLFAFGRVFSAISGAEKFLNINAYNREAEARDVRYNAKLAYYAALLAKKTHAIVAQSYENAVANKKILEDRSATGRVSKKDNIKISSDIATRRPVLNNALVSLKTSMNTLGRVIGVTGKEIVLTSDFDDDQVAMDVAKRKESLLVQEPTLQALEETVRFNEELVQIKKSAFYPEISAFGSLTHKGSDGKADVAGGAIDRYGIAGLKVEVPIWNGGERGAELSVARIETKNSELELEKFKNDLVLELDIALSEYHGFVETLASYEESVRLAKESFVASQDLFASGQISTTDLNDAELTLTNQRLNLEKTKYRINVLLAQIEKLTSEGQQEL